MASSFLIYGATGYTGEATARLAVETGLKPVIAGRDAVRIEKLAAELGVECRVFDLGNPKAIQEALRDSVAVLNCAGPFTYTYKPIVDACLETGTHYLDLTGELPVYEAIAALDQRARARGIMLLPGVGFDVVPTDCLALYLKQRLPSATHLNLAFMSQGPAGLPPGTQRTAIELIQYGNLVRRNGRLEPPEPDPKPLWIDFGKGPVRADLMTWGDVFTAYYSTGIPNIRDYAVLPKAARQLIAMPGFLRPLFKNAAVRGVLMRGIKPGATAEERDRTTTHVWGEVQDEQGRKAVARLHGPEPGVNWTAPAALAAVRQVLTGNAPLGFRTPAMAYGADFVLESGGVTREDVM